ncbi:hypothetical protein [Marisediminicola antarctica]|uniref:Uncharacterized protein n=1 Tax=Marisediminicola antarctica TaxID=674079 RepID=A0A7L5AFC7_9MICO|nr:hypothetical protein [Marisediminicola antarctica]QHO69163.1 hypothetical protein BHD05_05360 [Marisediminicola antarctica]
MTLNNKDEIAKALGEFSLDNLPEEKLAELVALFDDIPEELQVQLMKTNPELQKYALKAIAAVEDTLKATLSSNDASNQQALAALAQIREVIAGELNKDNISDERWRFLIETLIENGQMVVAKDTENKQFLAQQASADRQTKTMAAAMPYIETVLQIGVRIIISRGRV